MSSDFNGNGIKESQQIGQECSGGERSLHVLQPSLSAPVISNNIHQSVSPCTEDEMLDSNHSNSRKIHILQNLKDDTDFHSMGDLHG